MGELLRHLLERRDAATTARCLTAMLRTYSDRLLHPATAEDEDDADFGLLEAAEDEL